MSSSLIVDDISKRYRLGLTHSGTIRDAINNFASRIFRSQPAKNAAVSGQDRSEQESFWALRNVAFQVNQGEVIGIIGSNGAGKSTLLKLISRITRPTSGEIKIFGRVASLLEVGTGFHEELTGRENIYLNGTLLGMTRREVSRQLDAIVDFAGVEKFLDTPVKRYSSGMSVRLGFAVAAHLDPEILIVDEVLAVGDVEFQKRCLEKMQSVVDSGKTVLFVSHNMTSIRTLTKRTIVLGKGEVLFDGAPTEGIQKYLDANLNTQCQSESVADAQRSCSDLSRQIEFHQISINESDPNNSVATNSANQFQIEATVFANDDSEEFVVGVTVYSDQADPIGNTFSEIQSAMVSGSRRSLSFRLDAPLAPGKYHCELALWDARSRGNILYDSLSHVLPFEVTPSQFGEGRWRPEWGRVLLPPLKSKASFAASQDGVEAS